MEKALDFLRKEEKKVQGDDGLNRPGNNQHDGSKLNKQLKDAGAKVLVEKKKKARAEAAFKRMNEKKAAASRLPEGPFAAAPLPEVPPYPAEPPYPAKPGPQSSSSSAAASSSSS